jgi:hypothetical protein
VKTAVFAGHARAPANSVTGQLSKIIQVVMEIDKINGTIVDADVNVASPVSRRYLVSMLVGRNLMGELGVIARDIERDYHSPSQKAIVQALHDLYQQYMSDYLKIMSTKFGYIDL